LPLRWRRRRPSRRLLLDLGRRELARVEVETIRSYRRVPAGVSGTYDDGLKALIETGLFQTSE
jgi:hypothetical protein